MKKLKFLFAVLSILSTATLSPAEFVAMGGLQTGGGSTKVLTGDDGTFISNPAAFLPTVATSVSWNKRAGNLLAAGGGFPSGENDIVLYQLDSTTGSFTKRAHEEFASPGVGSLKWSPDGKHLAVGGGDSAGLLKVYELCGSNIVEVAQKNDFPRPIISLDWSADGKHIVTLEEVGSPNPLKVFAFTTNSLQLKVAAPLDGQGLGRGAVSWSCDNKHLVVAPGSGRIDVIAFLGNTLTPIAQAIVGPPTTSVDWSCDGRFVVSGGVGGDLNVFLFEDDDLDTVDSEDYGNQDITSVAWYPNGRLIAIAIGDEVKTIFFDLNNQQLVPVPAWTTPHGQAVFSVDVTCCLPAFCEEEM